MEVYFGYFLVNNIAFNPYGFKLLKVNKNVISIRILFCFTHDKKEKKYLIFLKLNLNGKKNLVEKILHLIKI
jgi:hypothetical protein